MKINKQVNVWSLFANITHHLDNRARFEPGLSRFATGMVLRLCARLATTWQRNVVVISKFSVLYLGQ